MGLPTFFSPANSSTNSHGNPLLQPTNPYASPQAPIGFEQLPQHGSQFRRIINLGLRLYINNLLPITFVTLVVWMPLEIFQAYMDYFVFEPDDLRSSFRLGRALENFFGIIAMGSVIALEDAYVRGEQLTPWEALGEGFSAWPRLIWTRVVRGFLLLLAFLALIIPGIYFMVRLTLAEQVAVIEHESGTDGIKRAHELSQGRFWLLLGLTFAPYAIVVLIALGLGVPLALFPEIDHWLLSAVIGLFVHLLMQIPTSILVATYFDFLGGTPASTNDSHPLSPPG